MTIVFHAHEARIPTTVRAIHPGLLVDRTNKERVGPFDPLALCFGESRGLHRPRLPRRLLAHDLATLDVLWTVCVNFARRDIQLPTCLHEGTPVDAHSPADSRIKNQHPDLGFLAE